MAKGNSGTEWLEKLESNILKMLENRSGSSKKQRVFENLSELVKDSFGEMGEKFEEKRYGTEVKLIKNVPIKINVNSFFI